MPIFEYRCRDCATKFEKIVSASDARTACTNCGSTKVDQLLSVFAVAGHSRDAAAMEPGPCGACGAARRGMCEE